MFSVLACLRHEQLARGAARGVGNPVFYVGAETGRDGLAGAAFASRELTEESREDRPAVQVGDPFKEKLLLEACLELLATDAVAGIQDMGAAGLTCSTCETASRGGSGIEIDLAKVPKREPGMTPYEILLSESQERMLIIAKRGREKVVREIFAEMGCALRGNRPGHRRRHDASPQQRDARRGNSRQTAGRRSAALFPRSQAARFCSGGLRPPCRQICQRSITHRSASPAPPRSHHCFQKLGLPAIRSHCPDRHRG